VRQLLIEFIFHLTLEPNTKKTLFIKTED